MKQSQYNFSHSQSLIESNALQLQKNDLKLHNTNENSIPMKSHLYLSQALRNSEIERILTNQLMDKFLLSIYGDVLKNKDLIKRFPVTQNSRNQNFSKLSYNQKDNRDSLKVDYSFDNKGQKKAKNL